MVAAFLVLCFGAACGNSAEEEWPPPVQHVQQSRVLSPEEALHSFSLPPGYHAEVVAAEPLLEHPVDIQVDADGRLWAVEMRGWMTALLPSQADDRPMGRVVVLEDTSGDGRMDQSTVFLDSLRLPRSVLATGNGVLVGEPPHLWLAKDTDGDLKADVKTEVRSDYGDPGANPEAMANSLRWGMDNWVHNAHYPGRFRHAEGAWTYDSTLSLGQWGATMDNHGRFYRTWNADPLVAAMLDPHYFARNPHLVEASGADVSIASDAAKQVWPVRSPTWVNRGYREDVLREDRTLSKFTAASGPAVYRGDRYPADVNGDVFVPEPAGNLVRRFEIIRGADSTLKAVNAYDQTEFMTSTDERFRPVNMYSAPDGTLYVVDMYKGVIQWSGFLTPYLTSHIEDAGLLGPLGMGRVYRIVHESASPRKERPRLAEASNQELVASLADANGWWRDTAQQLLVERKATDVTSALQEMARSGGSELARLHALWTLEGTGGLTFETVRHALSDDAPAVRAAAVRVAEPWLQGGDADALRRVARLTNDPAQEVRLQLAASLGEVPPPAADSAMAALLTHASEQPYLTDAVVSGLYGRELAFMQHLVQEKHGEAQEEGSLQTLRTLAATIINTGDAGEINRMLQLISDEADLPQTQRLALLEGIEALIPAQRSGLMRPLELKEEPAALAQVTQASDPVVREKAQQVAARLVWPGKEGYTPVETTLVTAAQKRQFKDGEQLFKRLCVACHQADGQGQAGVAASLVGSEWVLGQRKDLARIVLDGKLGETGAMPPLRDQLSNEEVAAVLTYIRNAWKNEASPVPASTVGDVRKSTATRGKPWTDEALRVMEH